MGSHPASGDALVVAAVEGRGQAQMRGAGSLPETRVPGPIGRAPGAHRHPHLDPDPGRVATGRLGQTAQPVEDLGRGMVGRIGVGHPAVAPFGDALEVRS